MKGTGVVLMSCTLDYIQIGAWLESTAVKPLGTTIISRTLHVPLPSISDHCPGKAFEVSNSKIIDLAAIASQISSRRSHHINDPTVPCADVTRDFFPGTRTYNTGFPYSFKAQSPFIQPLLVISSASRCHHAALRGCSKGQNPFRSNRGVCQ